MNYTRRKLEIIKEIFNSGILDFMNEIVTSKIRHGKIIIDNDKELEYGQKLRLGLEKLGPVFVKFGQLLSSRRDIFSDNIVFQLEKLQDNVKVLEFDNIKETFYSEFHQDIEEVFIDFDKEPLASGSIAQVYYGKIKDKGEIKEVCIKILRNDIKDIIETDTKIMLELAKKYSSKNSEIETFDLVNTIEEFRKSLFKEINFQLEKNNLKKFYELNKDDKFVHSPKVIEEYSKDKVLTMEYIRGKSIREIVKNSDSFKKSISEKLVYSYVNQCFSYGFFQADPHPGNIFVNDKKEIFLLDFGIVGSLSENYRFQIMKIFCGASFNQVKLISDAVINMGLIKTNFSKIGEFENRIQSLLDNYLTMSLHEMKISDLIEDFFDLLRDFNIKIPADLT
ncbi:MAG: AarF/UbiB family protein, partial [Porphyromonadaceae bacterium]|nr:AarF/UbiB family protein [Porphyromonadaceae bacterium]